MDKWIGSLTEFHLKITDKLHETLGWVLEVGRGGSSRWQVYQYHHVC